MPVRMTRRGAMTGLASFGLLSAGLPAAFAKTSARIVVIGGGFGGATAARTVKRLLPSAAVTLIEPNETYLACPFSNLVIGGTRDLDQQAFGYGGIAAEGIDVVRDRASDVDPVARTVTLQGGSALSYDRLIVSPGIDIRWGALPGYDEAAAQTMPHAWKAGAQTMLLRRQLEAIEDGGTVVMSAPLAPFRCPPGPYERASLIAHYLKTRKPRSKLIVLDAKDRFSKQPLFLEAWAAQYPDHLEWRGASDDGRVARVNPSTMTVETDFDSLQADVANIIPPQKAAAIADRAGVADATGWCPVDAVSFESALQAGIHVIGDAVIAAPMPKSAFSANLQGKVCAIQIARLLAGMAPEPTVLANTCYSYVTPDTAVSITGVYSNDGSAFANVPGAGGLSPMGAAPDVRTAEAAQAADWFRTVTDEAFG